MSGVISRIEWLWWKIFRKRTYLTCRWCDSRSFEMHDVSLRLDGPRWMHFRLRSYQAALHCTKCGRCNSFEGAYDHRLPLRAGEGERVG